MLANQELSSEVQPGGEFNFQNMYYEKNIVCLCVFGGVGVDLWKNRVEGVI